MAVATEAGPAPQVEEAAPEYPPGADYHGYQGYGFGGYGIQGYGLGGYGYQGYGLGGYGYGKRPAPNRPNKYEYKGSVVDNFGEYRE